MNCNCLCVANHGQAMGICTASADTSIAFDSPTTGRVDVPMCSACAAATLALTDKSNAP